MDEKTTKTIEYFKANKIKKIYLAHCTSDEVCEEFKRVLPRQTHIVKVGKIYSFEE